MSYRKTILCKERKLKEKAERERDEAREKYCEVLTDNMLHIATITRLERDIEELVDLVAYGLGQQESIWSLDAMRKAREAIAKAKNF